MVPGDAVTPLSAFIAPANTSDLAEIGAVDEVVRVECSVELEHLAATRGDAAATPEYSATDARIAPLVSEVTVTVVAPAWVLLRYQMDSIPSESASYQPPLRLSATFGPDWVRTMATSRSPLETGRGSTADSEVPDPSAATL